MNIIDGTDLHTPETYSADFIIIGSGPAGASAAWSLSQKNFTCLVIEEGRAHRPADFPEESSAAMRLLYRDFGASVMLGNNPMPFVQGRALGGTSVINGAISWRLPTDILDAWLMEDPGLGETLSQDAVSAKTDITEKILNIHPTPENIAGAHNLLLARGAEALGLEHRPISRNVKNCRGLGRCLQGCPEGNKMSMDRSFLPLAAEKGCRIITSLRARRILTENDRATGVLAETPAGVRINLRAGRGVILAASAVQSPFLLMQSGIKHGPVGRFFRCHPGVSMAGRFREEVKIWQGATQGHEVIGLRKEGIKFEALGYGKAIAASRLKGFGNRLAEEIRDLDHWANWGAAIRAEGIGVVKAGSRRAKVSFRLSRNDILKVRRGLQVMGEMMLAAGAEYVTPGVPGWHEKVSDPAVMRRFCDEAPLAPKNYAMAATHLFGTCRMHSDRSRGVVGPDFQHHTVSSLYVTDSSVFPSNTGVNPQTSIIAFSLLASDGIAAAHSR